MNLDYKYFKGRILELRDTSLKKLTLDKKGFIFSQGIYNEKISLQTKSHMKQILRLFILSLSTYFFFTSSSLSKSYYLLQNKKILSLIYLLKSAKKFLTSNFNFNNSGVYAFFNLNPNCIGFTRKYSNHNNRMLVMLLF